MFQEILNLGIPVGWRVNLIQGFVKGFSYYLNGKKLQLILISRRSRKRAGTRYNARGLDDEGNVANFCETEQIFIYDDVLLLTVVPLFARPDQGQRPHLLGTDRNPDQHPHYP